MCDRFRARCGWCLSVGLMFVLPPGSHADEAFLVQPGERQLFLDDHGVSSLEGLTRTMHQPQKRGAVVRPDIPADGWLIQIRSAPVWDPRAGEYKLYYLAYPDNATQIGMALATSPDGLHWTKSHLGQQVEVLGSVENNRVFVDRTPGQRPASFLNIIYDAQDTDESRRFKGFVGDINRVPITSPDGIRWTRLDVPSIASSDESSLTYDAPRRRFLAFVKSGSRYGRAHNLAVSEDFQHWTEPEFCFGADAEDQPLALTEIRRRLADPGLSRPVFVDPEPVADEPPRAGPPTWRTECYFISVFPYAGAYIGMPTMFYPTGVDANGTNCDGFDLIQLAVSRDLVHWERLGNREPFLPPGRIDDGRVGVWDRTQMFATPPIERDDELWFYYSALKWRDDPFEFNPDRSRRDPATLSDEERADREEGWGAVCLAVLRRDGFISLDAGRETGTVTTQPFQWSGDGLVVNARTHEDGQVVVEVLNPSDEVVAVSRPLVGDRVREEIQWSHGTPQTSKDRQVRLRFSLRSGELYSWWLKTP